MKKPKKFQSYLKYDSTLEHLFLLDGIVYRGMSGGGVFIQENEGEKKLVGIIGANPKNEQAVIMVTQTYNIILEEIKSQPDSMPALSQKTLCIDYRVEAAVATGKNVHCLSKSGTKFIVSKDEVHDTGHGGKIWSRLVKSGVNALEAQKHCQRLGMKLPSGYPSQTEPVSQSLSQEMKTSLLEEFGTNESDFTIAEKHGIREVISDLNDELSWSSTSHPLFEGVFGVFSGQTQSINYFSSRFKSNSTVGRCIK